MKHKTSHALFAYWNELRGQRIAPRRFEIEPSRIASILPDTFILDCGDPSDFRFRLAGTRMSALIGQDVRDSQFLDMFCSEDRRGLQHLLAQAIAQAPVLILTTATMPFAAPTAGPDDARPPTIHGPCVEIVLLPLFHTQNAVTRLLGCAVPLDVHQPGRPVRALPHAIVAQQTVWPDGRPHAILDHMDRQSPFAPRQQVGRIVASDRRRFRVFDGGKSP